NGLGCYTNPQNEDVPKVRVFPKKRVDAIKEKEGGSESSEAELDRGKCSFVTPVIGGFTILLLNSSYEDEDCKKEAKNNKAKLKIYGTYSISGGLSSPRGRSKGTTKRRIADMCSVRADTSYPMKVDMPMLGFNDEEYLGGAPNAIFPLIIIVTMAGHDVSRVLVDQGSSCDIMLMTVNYMIFL
ncbi:hypothetical protein A2U01_0037369, partial [Trifolium medium]|nr:hypothetical protein [Trifolium medium]